MGRAGYMKQYMKEHYKDLKIYFPGKKEKECTKEYAKEYKEKSLRKYILDLLLDEDEPDTLYPIQRRNKNSGKYELCDYKLMIPLERYDEIADMAAARGMKISTYIMARIKTDMQKNEYSMQETDERYIIFYKVLDTEATKCASTIEHAENMINGLKEENATDILLVDTLTRERRTY